MDGPSFLTLRTPCPISKLYTSLQIRASHCHISVVDFTIIEITFLFKFKCHLLNWRGYDQKLPGLCVCVCVCVELQETVSGVDPCTGIMPEFSAHRGCCGHCPPMAFQGLTNQMSLLALVVNTHEADWGFWPINPVMTLRGWWFHIREDWEQLMKFNLYSLYYSEGNRKTGITEKQYELA